MKTTAKKVNSLAALQRLMTNPKFKYITITEKQIADARDNQVKYPTHREYVADRFLTDHGCKVIFHTQLLFFMSPNEKAFMYVGELGVTITQRVNG